MKQCTVWGVRKIIHIDMDAFFASVEQRDQPDLRGRPVAVGFSSGERGVVAAASYEARRFGVRSAMPATRANRLCPHLVWVKPDFHRYRAISRAMRDILSDYTDLIEPLSLDECFLDVTTNKPNIPYAARLADELRTRIRDELGLTASAGVAPVKFVAKIASDHRKPDGLTVIPPERVQAFLHPLPVERLWGVGPATARRLHHLGITRIADVVRRDPIWLTERLGKLGLWLHRLAHGDDPRPVKPHRERKSRGAERTFHADLETREAVEAILLPLSTEVLQGLVEAREQARCITLKVRYGDFTTITRSRTALRPFTTADEAHRALIALLDRTEVGDRPVRLVGVSFSHFDKRGPQLSLPLE